MIKYRIIISVIIFSFIISVLYPLFNNEKNIWLEDNIKTYKVETTFKDTTTSKYYLINKTDTFEISKNVLDNIKYIKQKHNQSDFDFVGAFDENGIIYKIYSSRYKQTIFFFRFDKKVHMFHDCCSNNLGIYQMILFLVIFAMLFINTIMYWDNTINIYEYYFIIFLHLFYIIISNYVYTYFETAWVILPILILYAIIIFNYSKILKDYRHIKNVNNKIKTKTKELFNNYEKLLNI